MKKIFGGLGQFFKSIFAGDVEGAIEGLKVALEGLKQVGAAVSRALQKAWQELLNWLGQKLGPEWKAFFERIGGYFGAWVANLKLGFQGIITFIKGVFTGNWRSAWNGVVQAFSSAFGRVRSIASSALGAISGLVSSIASKVSGLISKISSAKSGASSLPSTVPGNALGTSYWKGGWTRINEKGGEILNLPRGTQIIPHDVSMEIARNAGAQTGSRSITIAKIADTVTIREEADINKIAQAIAEEIEKVEGDVVHDAA